MAWDTVKFYAFSNEANFEEIGPLVQKLLTFVRLGFKREHCALVFFLPKPSDKMRLSSACQLNEAIGLPLMTFSTRGMPAPRATSAQVAAQLPFGLDQSACLPVLASRKFRRAAASCARQARGTGPG